MRRWQPLAGDGSDRLPLDTWYHARRRDGKVHMFCRITPFCLKLGDDLFKDSGKPWAPVAIMVLNEADVP